MPQVGPLDVLPATLLLVWALKCCSIFSGIRWIRRRGPTFRAFLRTQPPRSEHEHFEAILACGGHGPPFGVKDCRLILWARWPRTVSRPQRLVRRGVGILHAWIYRYDLLTWWTGIVVVTHVVAAHALSRPDARLVLIPLAFVALFANALMSVEALFSYVLLGGFGRGYHTVGGAAPLESQGRRLMSEFLTFGMLFGTLVVSGGVACFAATVFADAIGGKTLVAIPNEVWSMGWVELLFQCAYFVVTTVLTVGYGDLVPANVPGQVVAFMCEVEGVLLIGVVLASLLATGYSSKDAERETDG